MNQYEKICCMNFWTEDGMRKVCSLKKGHIGKHFFDIPVDEMKTQEQLI